MNILRILNVLCCFLLLSAGVNGQKLLKNKKQPECSDILRSQLMEQKASKLIADRVDVTKKNIISERLAPITYVTNEELLEAERLRFPADELYESNWDTRWVNPFHSKDITFPDTFEIDCSSFVIPIDNEIKITSKYGPRRRRMHRGIDLKLYTGDTVRAAFSGKIRIKNFERRGYGNYLVIRHPNGLETVYGHLSKFLVSENEIVRAGQPIALGGNTGRSTGPHLHFETRFLGETINPSDIIDFENRTPHKDFYVFHKNTFHNRKNPYTSTSEYVVYHRIKKGETLSHIAQKYHISVRELCRLNGLKRTSTLRIGQTIRCSKRKAKKTKKETQSELAQNTEKAKSTIAHPAKYHKVQADETLISIARQHETTVDALCKLNNIHATTPLHIGQDICYRAAKDKKKKEDNNLKEKFLRTQKEGIIAENGSNNEMAKEEEVIYHHRVQRGETLNAIARRYGTSVDELCMLNNITPEEKIQAGQQLRYKTGNGYMATTKKTSQQKKTRAVYHRVRKGDTLGAIARQHGVSVNQLCKLNKIQKTTILKIGRSLRCS